LDVTQARPACFRPRLEQADERACGETAADGLHFREAAAAPKHIEERRRLSRGFLELHFLVGDDAP